MLEHSCVFAVSGQLTTLLRKAGKWLDSFTGLDLKCSSDFSCLASQSIASVA